MFSLQSLEIPLIAAPMAGGVSTPELVGAVGAAGGCGFVAGGYLTADQLASDIHLAQSASVLFGVNVFVPDEPPAGDQSEVLAAYRDAIAPVAERLGVEVGEPLPGDDDWDAKIDLLCSTPVPMVSFTFGAPPKEVVDALHDEETYVLVTVTTVEEALAGAASGADALVVQGPEAGGHRGTFVAADEPGSTPLPLLLAEVREAVELPLVAAGGLTTGPSLRAALDAGAYAAQLGTAFLLADEAGTPTAIRKALTDPHFIETRLTRAFTGRWARSLENEFARDFTHLAPPLYPQVNAMTRPIRTAALAARDPQALSLWAGTTWRDAQPGPAADILRGLWTAARS